MTVPLVVLVTGVIPSKRRRPAHLVAWSTWAIVAAGGCGVDVLGSAPAGTEGTTDGAGPSTSIATGSTDATASVGPHDGTASTGSNEGTGSSETTADTLGDATGLPDDAGIFECDPYVQDCPPGEKCMAWSPTGGPTWTSTRCSPIVPEPDGLLEPCTIPGSIFAGLDTCELGLMCYAVDPAADEGQCLALCTGREANAWCDDPDTSCLPMGGVLQLCLPECDPLLQDCLEGWGCYALMPQEAQEGFNCLPIVGTGGDLDPCETVTDCAAGWTCLDAAQLPSCVAASCCTPWCDLGDPGVSCPEPALGGQCIPWFERGGFFGLEDFGVCSVSS